LLEFENTGPPEIAPHEIEYLEEIGRGCFGSVHRGKCRGKEVAIKQLFKQELTQKAMEEFRKEIDICSVLRHPNIVLFMGACLVPGHMAIVSELMRGGNLQELLHDRNANLSLFFRTKVARDVAMGMNWLHRSNPQVIHRDLKPSNVLVDSNHNVKICDFGLSAVKLLGESIVDVDSIPGTPLWMAPEVMMGRPLDEKADVYSYGVVLWEIITQQAPFSEFGDYRVFREAVCKRGVRPPIDDTMLPSLADMIQLCWHQDPHQRPGFDQIIPMFDTVFIDVCIPDPVGNRFWRKFFLNQDHNVPWNSFVPAYRKFTKSPQDELKENCLKAIAAQVLVDATKKVSPHVVNIEHFGRVLQWFGPFEDSPSFLDKICEILQEKWFHGDVSKDEAENSLKMKGLQVGTFLVRLSSSKAGQFTISRVNKQKKMLHQRIDYDPDTGFCIKLNTTQGTSTIRAKESLREFLGRLSKPCQLERPCDGSKYEALFKSTEIGSYDLVDD